MSLATFTSSDLADEEVLMAQALGPALGDDDDTDDDAPAAPVTGEDYVRRVRREANKLNLVTIAESIPAPKPSRHEKHFAPEVTGADAFRQSASWVREQVSDFSDTRLQVERHLAVLEQEKEAETKADKANKLKLPGKENERGWAIFCYGAQTWNDILAKRMEEEDDESEEEEDDTVKEKPVEVTDDNREGHLPHVSLICRMKPSACVRVFEHHVSWVEAMDGLVLPQMGPWVYALLSRVDKPLHPDVASALRTLVRACRVQREEVVMTGDEKAINSLTLFICLGAKYFGQEDLADPLKEE